MTVSRERGAIGASGPETVSRFISLSRPGRLGTPLRATALTPCRMLGAPLSRSARTGLAGLAGREMVLERVATYSRSAATVTQGGGVSSKGFSPSLLAQGHAGRPGGNSEPRDLRGVRALVGGLE